MSSSSAIPHSTAPPVPYPFDSYRDRLEYELTVRQEPKQARMCGVGGKADRRPIDPPPIVQLRVIDPGRRANNSGQQSNSPTSPSTTVVNSPTPSTATNRDALRDSSVTDVDGDEDSSTAANAALGSYAQSFLQNPYFFMFASLAKPDDDAELHWLKDGRTRCTTGSTVSSLFSLKDPHHNNEDAGFFVFPDLSVRTEGSYRLKLSLYELVGYYVRHCKSVFSAPFYVYTAKKFPGMEESTPLSCSMSDQGIKVRIRKDIRVRKRPVVGLQPIPGGNSPNSNPGVSTFSSTSQFAPTSTNATPAPASAYAPGYTQTPPQQNYPGFNHPTSNSPQVVPYQQQYHPLAPPPGSTPASGPLQPLPAEAQPGWVESSGVPSANHKSRSPSLSRRSSSPMGREDDERRSNRGPSPPNSADREISRMDVDAERQDDDQLNREDNEARPSSSSGRLTRTARGRSSSARDMDDRRKSKESPKLKPKSSRRENKRARTDSYHQPIAPAPWAPAPQPPLVTPSHNVTAQSNSSSSPGNATFIRGTGVPSPIIDPSLNGVSIGGLPPGVRIPPPPGALIAPGASALNTNTRSQTATPIGANAGTGGTAVIRIPPPPGAAIESTNASTSNNSVASSNNSSSANATSSVGLGAPLPSAMTTMETGNPDTQARFEGSGTPITGAYQHQHVPYEQSQQVPPSYGVQPHLTGLPPPHPAHPTQYPGGQQQQQQQPLPIPHGYNPYHQPIHPQYPYGAPPPAGYPPPMVPTPQGYAGYGPGGLWGVPPNQQIADQYQQVQMQYQQPQYGYPHPPVHTQARYDYNQPQPQAPQHQPLPPGPHPHHLQPSQPVYTPYVPAPYGYYDHAQTQQNPQQGFPVGNGGTHSPNAVGAAPNPGAPPLLGPGQPGQTTQPSTTPPNGAANGYVDYNSPSYASQPPPGPPRLGSPRYQHPPAQYGSYPVPPPPPHAHPHGHAPMQMQHPQHHHYPMAYNAGYVAYGAAGGNATTSGFSSNGTGASGGDVWGMSPVPSSGVPSWDAGLTSAPMTSASTNSTAGSGYPAGQQQPSAGAVGALGSPGDRIQLAPLRPQQSGSVPSNGGYPNVIQLRSGSRSRDSGVKDRLNSEITNISNSARERDRERVRERESYDGREREDKMRENDGGGRDDNLADRDRDGERGLKKNPLAIGNIIEKGT